MSFEIEQHIKLEKWPQPEWGEYPEQFKEINSKCLFDNIVLIPENRKIILINNDLYYKWVLPYAVLLFGKTWFDKLKWGSCISRGSPFSLFSQTEKDFSIKCEVPIEGTVFGKARIAKIIIKISAVLRKYLINGQDKPFGNYLSKSLKNNLSTEKNSENGLKMVSVLMCPNCLNDKMPFKVPLQSKGDFYECPRCKNLNETFKLIGENREYQFSNIKKMSNKYVWKNPLCFVEDDFFQNSCFYDIEEYLTNLKYANLLIDYMILQLSRINPNSISGVYSWCFNLAVIHWLEKHWKDAVCYLFSTATFTDKNNRKVINGVRGQDNAIHQEIWSCLVGVIEQNIKLFQNLNINSLDDIKWFAKQPLFTAGPRDVFKAVVDENQKICNNTNIQQIGSKHKPRLAKIFSIFKIIDENINTDYNYVQDVKKYGWHNIQLTNLQKGEVVQVECLVMSGHPTHAPIQRIIKLKRDVLAPFIKRIVEEEDAGQIDKDFWCKFYKDVNEAREKTGIKIKLSR